MTASGMKPSITAREHYDRLADAGHGRNDPELLREYMARWNGPPFWEALGDLRGKDVLEVGIGYGRVARQVLERGCGSLTGIDVSPGTIAAAGEDLAGFSRIELVLADICDFMREKSFDAAYSVLTMMHVQDKRRALKNMACSLRPGGRLILSIDNRSDLLDFGDWNVKLYPWAPECYAEVLGSLGCVVCDVEPVIDTWVRPDGIRSDTYGQKIAVLIKAIRL